MKKLFLALSLVVFLFGFVGCKDSPVDTGGDYIKGNILGYIKCYDKAKDKLNFGLLISTESKDTLLSFNVNYISLNIDIEALEYGAYPFEMLVFNSQSDNDVISFKYRTAKENEVLKPIDFLCPQNEMLPGLSFPVDDIQQVMIVDIESKKE